MSKLIKLKVVDKNSVMFIWINPDNIDLIKPSIDMKSLIFLNGQMIEVDIPPNELVDKIN